MIQDSGERRVFDTGAQRDRQIGKGRMDLLPYRALMEVAKLFEQGAIKYESRNWEKGMPIKEFLDSGARHHAKCMIGELDEPHLVQWCWNALCALDTYLRIQEGVLPRELMNDLPFTEFKLTETSKPLDKRSMDRGPLIGDTRSIYNTLGEKPPKVGDVYSIFGSKERVTLVTDDHTILTHIQSHAGSPYSWEYWNKYCKSRDIYLVDKSTWVAKIKQWFKGEK